MPLRIPWKLFQPRLPRGAGGKEDRSGGLRQAPSPSIPQTLPTQPRTLPAVRVCVHLSHQGPVLVDCSPGFRSQVQERAGAAATAPADPLDDLGVGVGQLRQRASQLLLVSAGVITSEGAGLAATTPASVLASAHPGKRPLVCGGNGGTAPLTGCGSPPPEAPGALFPASHQISPGVAVSPCSDEGSSGQRISLLRLELPRVGPCLSLPPHPLFLHLHTSPHTLLH